ncbi:metal dependent phosphohydrolase [Sulfolobus islandicus Y.G.57.14]|jgi:HD superfamily phosphohydrolase|uniref:Metal-dependent phosphohydrolase HD sub domain protein n=3 Tax=Saccharolobus islandicus TaxID=43080 RepID=C3MJM8_SACI2|nr:HD domain-containing protein [Sulfolobus islandicus]ACP36181.1 metal-dependent phosphohydrolase HD sub domain protein [Sulfolobus islandicus L.S.2.15]ACP46404.1 metal dependent phosphohydrolase [Sulfolobus islandicus Y.G.57.14]ACP47889.1 metal dependent phosphohydrolase [Sulfolobus islandicus Y.N.15.51]
MKKVYDEIYAYIKLDDREAKIIDMPEFQRLRRIKQTSLAYLVYPGATHTRFSHSLGTFYLTTILSEKFKQLGIITDEESTYLKYSALLHDIGQFPFSHSLEPLYLEKGLSNKDLRYMIISKSPYFRDFFDKESIDYNKILDILNGNSMISSIINSDVDVDRMDYLVRDSRHTGVQLGNIDLYRLLDTIFYGNNNEIIVQDKGIYSLENFFISRLHMYQAVYYHKTIIGYELMLREIFRTIHDCCYSSILSVDNLRDLVYDSSISYWDDEWVFMILYTYLYSSNSPLYLKDKIRNFLDRRGPKVVYEEVSYNNEMKGGDVEIKELVDRLERNQIPRTSIYPIEEKIKILSKDKINIISKNNEINIIKYKSTLINHIPETLTIRRIYVDHEYAKRARDVVP